MPRRSRLPLVAWWIAWARRHQSYGVKVSTPSTRPTQSFAWRPAKNVPWPQSCWIMNRRTRKPPAGIAISNDAQAWPSENANQAAVHNATSGTAVITSSTMLRMRLGVR